MNELISSFPIEFDSIVNIKMIEVTSKILRNGHLNIWFQDSPIQPWVAHWKAWRVVGFIVSPPKEVELYHLCQRFDHPTLIPNLWPREPHKNYGENLGLVSPCSSSASTRPLTWIFFSIPSTLMEFSFCNWLVDKQFWSSTHNHLPHPCLLWFSPPNEHSFKNYISENFCLLHFVYPH